MTPTVAIGSVASFRKGSGLSKSDLSAHGSHPCIHYGELFTQYGAVINNVRSRTARDLPVKSARGDVLMPTSDVTPRGLAKASAILLAGVGLGGDVLVIRPDSGKVDSRYLAYAIRQDAEQVLALVRGSTVYHLYAADMRHFELYLPPIGEQERIASALVDADNQVDALERLIAKKSAMKQGMMQELLMGRTRLPGFSKPWREVSIGDLAVVDPETLPSGTSAKTEIDYISLEDVSQGELLGSTRLMFGQAPSRARRVIRERDVLFGTVRPNLQSHLYYRGGLRRPVASTGFAVVRAAKGNDPGFIFYLLMSDMAKTQVDRIIAGSNYPAVSSRDVRSLSFRVALQDEQVAIAAVLNDIDAEVVALKNRLSKAVAVRTGLMQELLSGRTRLPVAEALA